MTASLRSAAKAAGRPEYMSLWAGQATDLMQAGTAVEIIERLIADADKTIAGLDRT